MAFACQQFSMSERRACKLLAIDRSSYRYEPRPDHNAALRGALEELARNLVSQLGGRQEQDWDMTAGIQRRTAAQQLGWANAQ